MTNEQSREITRRKQNWIDLYDGKRHAVPFLYYNGIRPRPFPRPDNIDERVQWAIDNYELQLTQMDCIHTDNVPFLQPFTGTELFAAAFGAQVHYPDDNMPFALPMVHCVDECTRIPDVGLDAKPLADVFGIADRLKQAHPDALLALPDIQSPLDIAALLWGKEDFFPSLLAEPEAVLSLVDKTEALLIAFLDEWFARYGTETIAHFPDYYFPRGVTLSEDEVGSISPALFETFSLPSLTALSNRYGGIGMHCCAHSTHQWTNFKKIPNLKLLNLSPHTGTPAEAFTFFDGHSAQMHGTMQVTGTSGAYVKHFIPCMGQIVVQAEAGTKEEAIAKSILLQELVDEYEKAK